MWASNFEKPCCLVIKDNDKRIKPINRKMIIFCKLFFSISTKAIDWLIYFFNQPIILSFQSKFNLNSLMCKNFNFFNHYLFKYEIIIYF